MIDTPHPHTAKTKKAAKMEGMKTSPPSMRVQPINETN